MKVTAAVLQEPRGQFLVQDIEIDHELQPNEVMVKILATGLCHTDLAVRDQHIPVSFPVVLGHEGAGTVFKTGTNVTSVKVGDRVVLAPSSCGKCSFCLSGHPSYCVELYLLNMAGPRSDGSCPYHDALGHPLGAFFFGQSSFGTYSLTSERNLVKIDDKAPLEIMGPLGCGIQTGAGTVLNVLRPSAGSSIVVFGTGPVGLAAIMAAKASGCSTIVAVDIHDNRLTIALELGATHAINSSRENPSEKILTDILSDGLHFSIDTTGRGEVIHHALASLRFMGTCALLGVPSVAKLELDYSVFNSGRSVVTVVEGDSVPSELIPRLIALYLNGLFPFDRLIKFYDLQDINQAVADTESGITLKAVIRMPQ